MGTIAKLVAETSVDSRQVRPGLADAARQIESFTRDTERTVQVSASRMAQLLKQTGGDLQAAARLAYGELDTLKRKSDSIAIAIANMRKAAGARPPGGGPGGDDALARAIRANDPFQNVWQGIRNNPAMQQVPALAKPETARGLTRTQGALLSVAFTLGNLGEQLSAADTKWQKLDRVVGTALQTIAQVAVFFGPGGILVAAIATVGNFLSSFWTQQREEAEKAAKAMEEAMQKVIDSRDTMAQQQRAHELFAGTPSSGYRGIAQLQREQADVFAKLDFAKVYHPEDLKSLQQQLLKINDELVPMENEFERLKQAILDVNNTPLQVKGLAGVKSTAVNQTAEQATSGLVQRAQSLLALQKAMTESGADNLGVISQLATVYDGLVASLDAMGNKWSDQAIVVRKIIEDINASPLADLLKQGVPGVRATPSNAPMKTPTITPAAVGGGGATVGAQVMAAIGPFLDVLTGTLGPTLEAFASALGPATLLLMAVQPALELLGTLLGKFIAPVAAVVEVMVQALEPALRLLYPIVRAAAWVLALFAEMMERVTSALARVVGNVIIAVGEVIKKLSLGFAGKGLIRAGQSILDFADQTKKSADQMADTRKKLGGMDFGQTADDITGLGDAARLTAEALRNIPEIWKINLAKFAAAQPISPPTPPPPGGTPEEPTTPGGPPPISDMPTGLDSIYVAGDLYVDSDPDQLLKKVRSAAATEGARTTGRPTTWLRSLPG